MPNNFDLELVSLMAILSFIYNETDSQVESPFLIKEGLKIIL